MMRGVVKLMMGRNLLCSRASRSIRMYNNNATNNSSHTWYDYYKINYNHDQYAATRDYYNSKAVASKSYTPAIKSPYDSTDAEDYGEEGETDGVLDSVECDRIITKGDVVNLHDLLFTDYRDYLIRYNDDRLVKAAQLEGKVIVLFFVPLKYPPRDKEMCISNLIETYTYLLPDNAFEVVLVAYEECYAFKSDIPTINVLEKFEYIFQHMPWTAIPFPDINSRERLAIMFGIKTHLRGYSSFVIDSTGMVLQSHSCDLFQKYGGLAYPFSDQRLEFLKSEADATAKKHSIKALLGSPKRDYLISNKGDKVFIDDLEGKVVALFFYEEGFTNDDLTKNVKKVYKEFALQNSSFEVVLIYLHDTEMTFGHVSEYSYYKKFKTMPWLALPFKDPVCKRLKRYFAYPYDHIGPEEAPQLVIVGPHGKYIEPWGDRVIDEYGLLAYPPTRERVAKLHTDQLRELKLEMLWDRSTLFKRKDGSKVLFSQLVGKRIILFNEGTGEKGYRHHKTVVKSLNMLKQRYFDVKGTSNEFEVIYITESETESPYSEQIVDVPWLVSLSSELLPVNLNMYCCYCHIEATSSCRHGESIRMSSILAFDRDGRAVRKSLALTFDGVNFPFNVGGMQMEAFEELNLFYGWGDLDFYYDGLLINSYIN